MPQRSLLQRGLDLLRHEGKADPFILIPLILINLLVVFNAIWHHPKIGYDVVDNLTYIQVLSHRLPRASDTGEFFSPPLPFVLPSLFDWICTAHDPGALQSFNGLSISWTCRLYDGKFAQALNVILSIGVTALLLLIAEQLKPGNRFFKISILLLAANLTVYYKTFAQVRAEPYVLFFTLSSLGLIFGLLRSTAFNWKLVLATGVSLGCLILSRQWGFFFFPAMAFLLIPAYLQDHARGWKLGKQFASSIGIALLVGGWFYWHLYAAYGSFTAFNIPEPIYPSPGQILPALRQTHLQNFDLFREPVRPAFSGSILPILYSETWGDYWGYFVFIKANSSFGANGYTSGDALISYLGRVNLVAVPISLLFAAALFFGIAVVSRSGQSHSLQDEYLALICLVMLGALAGFSWFVYSYFLASSKILKATYMLSFLIALLFPAAELLERLRVRRPVAYLVILVLLSLILIHDLPAMITRYNMFNFH